MVDGAYLLKSKELRTARTGDMYLAIEIADKTGSVRGVMFRPEAAACSVPVGAVVAVRGRMSSFRGTHRVTLEAMEPAETWSQGELMATATRSQDELVAEFAGITKSVGDPDIRAVIRAVFTEQGFLDRFAESPGSESGHHAYLHGLLEHTLSVAATCDELAARYPLASRDLLLGAALLHDIGVADSLSWDAAIRTSEEGRLLGHVALTLRRIDRASEKAGLAAMPLLAHAIASHHRGSHDQSASAPLSLEAILLSRADELDVEASAYAEAVSGAASMGEEWTDSANRLGRPLRIRSASTSVSIESPRGKSA
jgi:3'-5' exoribonuclease